MVTLSQPNINSFNNAYDFMSIQQHSDFMFMSTCENANFTYNQQGTNQKSWSERVLHDITGLLYVLSPYGKILYCSESSLQLIGYPSNELVGRSITDFLHVDDLNLFINNFQYSFNSMTRVKVHYRIKCKNNSYVLLETIGHPKQDMSGQSFLAISQPYISRSNGLLDSFLEIKMENDLLKKRLNELISLQEKGDDSPTNYFSPMPSSSHFTTSPHTASPQLDFFPIQQQHLLDPPVFYNPAVTTPSPIQYTNKPTRRPSTGSNSPFFFFNTPLEESYNTNFTGNYFSNQNTPSIASSTDYNDVVSKISNDDLFQADNLLLTPSYLSSYNSSIAEQKDKWKKRKKNKSYDDYICSDCGTTSSPEWRKGPHGPKTLCNACGLRWAKKNKKI